MPRVFDVIETVTRKWRVTLTDFAAANIVAMGGEEDLEFVASDAIHDPQGTDHQRVALLSVERTSEVSPAEDR